jgi:hypothetical protein
LFVDHEFLAWTFPFVILYFDSSSREMRCSYQSNTLIIEKRRVLGPPLIGLVILVIYVRIFISFHVCEMRMRSPFEIVDLRSVVFIFLLISVFFCFMSFEGRNLFVSSSFRVADCIVFICNFFRCQDAVKHYTVMVIE